MGRLSMIIFSTGAWGVIYTVLARVYCVSGVGKELRSIVQHIMCQASQYVASGALQKRLCDQFQGTHFSAIAIKVSVISVFSNMFE